MMHGPVVVSNSDSTNLREYGRDERKPCMPPRMLDTSLSKWNRQSPRITPKEPSLPGVALMI
ncbi:MAG: hypothetical protein F7C09_06030 [Aeropyrum sp.]|nr:hypothetical protein [Aeropyrum sp.]